MISFFAAVYTTIIAATAAHAAAIPDVGSQPITQAKFVSLERSVQSFQGKISTYVFILLGSLALFTIMYAGFIYITSQGSPDATKRARQMIIYVVYGIVLTGSSYIIISILAGIAQNIAQSVTSA